MLRYFGTSALFIVLFVGLIKLLRYWHLRRIALKLTIDVGDLFTQIFDEQGHVVLKVANTVQIAFRSGTPYHLVTLRSEEGEITVPVRQGATEVQEVDLVHAPLVTTTEFAGVWGGFLRELCELARTTLGKTGLRLLDVSILTRTSNAILNRQIREEIESKVSQAYGDFRVVDSVKVA